MSVATMIMTIAPSSSRRPRTGLVPSTTYSSPVLCENCEMNEARRLNDPHRCMICGFRCCTPPPAPAALRPTMNKPLSAKRFVRRIFEP